MSARQLGLYLLLLLVVSATGWYIFSQDSGFQQTRVSDSGPDAFVEDMDLKVMNDLGQLAYRIKAAQMTHFPSDQRINLVQPDIKLIQSNGDTWFINSEHGETTDEADIIWLLGNVDIKRRATVDTEALHIVTSDLTVWPDEERAETDNAATISSPRMEIYGVGVRADFSNDTLELRSSVRGRFDDAS